MCIDYLSELNCEQRQAAEYGVTKANAKGCGPLLIIAGAGTGKTNTLAHRVAHLIVNGVDPTRILLLTFTRRAAAEMASRVQKITSKVLEGKRVHLPWSGTFHSVGAQLLRQYANRIGLKPSFTILDRSDATDLLDFVRNDLGFSVKEKRFPKKGTCLAIYSHAVNSGKPLEWVLAKHFPWCREWESELRTLFAEYVKAKQQQNVLDFDDLLLFCAEILKDPELAKEIGGKFDHVQIDEYQDTNRLQSDILLRLKPDGRGLMVVGDDAQAIYAFRAATVRNILDFPDQFKPPARIVTIEQNYRSTQPILNAANGPKTRGIG